MLINRVISLGRACRITYNLRRYFDFGEAFPFDWWVSSPDGLRNALDQTVDPYRDGNLKEVVNNHGIESIVTVDHGIRLQHEFPRNYNKTGYPVQPNWREHIELARSRFNYLRHKLLDLEGKRYDLLFVRHGDVNDNASMSLDLLANKVIELYPSSSVKFLFLNCGNYDPSLVNTSHIKFDESNDDWKGSYEEFSRALDKTGLVIEDDGRKLFTEINSVEYDDVISVSNNSMKL